jgi:hypothetical protein
MIVVNYGRKNMGYIAIENLKGWFIYWYIDDRVDTEFNGSDELWSIGFITIDIITEDL